jgi:hypothetical protein
MKTQEKSFQQNHSGLRYLTHALSVIDEIPACVLLILLVFIGFPNQSSAQDFILTKEGELKSVRIVQDYQYTIIYKSGETTHPIDKSEIRGYAVQNKVRKRSSDMVIVNNEGSTICGKLLYASADSLYFWRGSKNYNPSLGNFMAIGTNTIQRLAIHRSGSFKNGFKAGAIIGGTVGIINGVALDGFVTGSTGGDVLLSGAIFASVSGLAGGLIGAVGSTHVQIDSLTPSTLANALPTIKKNAMLTTPPIYVTNTESGRINWSTENPFIFKSPKTYPKSKITFSIVGGFELISAQRYSMKNSLEKSGQGGTVDNWFFSGTTTYPIRENGALFLDLGIDFTLKNSSRIALVYNSTSTFGARGIYSVTEIGQKKALELYYTFVPKPYIPLNTSKWETSLGIGPSVNFLQTKINVPGNGESLSETTKPGLAGHASWDYYITPQFSFTIRFIGRIVPGMNIQEFNEVKEHSVKFSSLDFGIGFKAHL